MARIERVYRVRAVYRNGDVEQRRYLTPKAAEERAERFRQGRAQALSAGYAADYAASGEEPPLDVPTVSVIPSHPIRYPAAAGDAEQLGMPDTLANVDEFGRALYQLAQVLGVQMHAIRSIEMVDAQHVTVGYSVDDRREPRTWSVELYDDEEVPEAEPATP